MRKSVQYYSLIVLAEVAMGKTVWVSSEDRVYTTVATVDGDPDTCFSTAVETNPWWTVDLDTEYAVTAVKLQTTDVPTGQDKF